MTDASPVRDVVAADPALRTGDERILRKTCAGVADEVSMLTEIRDVLLRIERRLDRDSGD